MHQIFILVLTLWSGVLVEPFRVTEAEPEHHQVCVRAAMAPDGHFAVTWVDSLVVNPGEDTLDIYIRFFDALGNPMTNPYRVEKTADSVFWLYWPCLEMDSSGNAILVWADNDTRSDTELSNIRFQRFGPDGIPAGPAQTIKEQVYLHNWRPIDIDLTDNGKFALVWKEIVLSPPGHTWWIWVQRFDLEGVPLNTPFKVHDDITDSSFSFHVPRIALSESGDVAVTWVRIKETNKVFHIFQSFDSMDESILPWEPVGHRVDDGVQANFNAESVEPFWLDDDRFIVFRVDIPAIFPEIFGRVFSAKGATRFPEMRLVRDSMAKIQDKRCSPPIALSSDERFVCSFTREHRDPDDYWRIDWYHQGGVLGEIEENKPYCRTTVFEVSSPWGADTIGEELRPGEHRMQYPAVGACDEQIVWSYIRPSPDSVFEVWVTLTDWDMGEGVVDTPEIAPHSFEYPVICRNALDFTLHSDSYAEIEIVLYDVSGRAVSQWTNLKPQGQLDLRGLSSGVYYLRVLEPAIGVHRVVVVK